MLADMALWIHERRNVDKNCRKQIFDDMKLMNTTVDTECLRDDMAVSKIACHITRGKVMMFKFQTIPLSSPANNFGIAFHPQPDHLTRET